MAKKKKAKTRVTKHYHPGKSLGFGRDQGRAKQRGLTAAPKKEEDVK